MSQRSLSAAAADEEPSNSFDSSSHELPSLEDRKIFLVCSSIAGLTADEWTHSIGFHVCSTVCGYNLYGSPRELPVMLSCFHTFF